MDLHGWNVIDADAGILWREYNFTKEARATTLVFRGADRKLVVISPATGLSGSEYDALSEFGEVSALIANNAHHHLGQKAWRERFKNAQSYAPPGAVDDLNKKTPGLSFRPLTELALPDHIRWEDPPGYKSGEVIMSIRAAQGSVWYSGDLLLNMVDLPPPPIRWIFTLTDSAPGLRLFKPGVWFFVKNRKVLRDWVLARLALDPPAVVVPAHGQPYQAADAATQAKAQLERL